MPHPLVSIDLAALAAVTGGGTSGSNIDQLLEQLNSITGTIKDIGKKTSGLDSTQMMMLCVLAMRQNQATNVVVVDGARRPGFWW